MEDDESSASYLDVSWFSDQHGDEPIGSSIPESSGTVDFTTSDLVEGSHTITMRVTDDADGICTTNVQVTILDCSFVFYEDNDGDGGHS